MKLRLCISFLFVANFLQAQLIHHVTADYFRVYKNYDIEYVQKRDDGYFRFLDDANDIRYHTKWHIENRKLGKDTIRDFMYTRLLDTTELRLFTKVNTLKKQTAAQLYEDLSSKVFNIDTLKMNEDSIFEVQKVLKFISNYKIGISDKITLSQTFIDNGLYLETYLYYTTIINGEYAIINIGREADLFQEGYLIPQNNGIRLFFNEKVWKESNIQVLKSENFYAEFQYPHYPDIYTENNLKGICEHHSAVQITPAIYDSIAITSCLIVAKNKQKTTIFNTFYDEIKIEKLQAALPFDYRDYKSSRFGIMILVNNKPQWLSPNGFLMDTIPSRRFYGCGMVTHYLNLIHQNASNKEVMFLETSPNNEIPYDSICCYLTPYFGAKDSLFFINKTFEYNYNENYDIVMPPNVLLVKKENQKLDICSILPNVDGFYLPAYHIRDMEETQMVDYEHYMIFKKNGLYGYYPQMTASKYKTLTPFRDYFARFSTPDGKMGWLDVHGNEYFDVQ
jgi:hypothetical protein